MTESNHERDERPPKYAHLPEPVRAEDLVEEQPTEAPHDPDGGRDPDNDFMLRYSG